MDVFVGKSKINKKGVFAAKDFEKGEVVLKWNPKILNFFEVEKLKSLKRYVYKVGKNKFFLMQAPERFVNHSCEANTEVKNSCDVAARKISKGEEITSDYVDDSFAPFKCLCGSSRCRGRVS
jgi:SET domain-containing protein